MATKEKDTATTPNEVKYTKRVLLSSAAFSGSWDAINILLDDDKQYTKQEIKEKLDKFYSTPIKEVLNKKEA